MKIFTRLCILTLLGLSSCTTVRVQKNVSVFKDPELQTNKLTADLGVGSKVSGRGNRYELLGFIQWGSNTYSDGVYEVYGNGPSLKEAITSQSSPIQRAKSAAAYDALMDSNADVIIAPKYSLIEKNYLIFKKYTAKVTGNKGTIENIRQVKQFNTDNSETEVLLKNLPNEMYKNALIEDYKTSLKQAGTSTIKNNAELTMMLGDLLEKEGQIDRYFSTYPVFREQYLSLVNAYESSPQS
jgi:hypothetical protein